jgi:hypothetical protein
MLNNVCVATEYYLPKELALKPISALDCLRSFAVRNPDV